MGKILLILICLAHFSFAQKSFFGVGAGINVADQREHFRTPSQPYSAILFYENTIKPSFGIYYQRSLSEVIALRLQVNYMGMGYKQTGVSNFNLDINYLTFPILFQYSANTHLSFSAGPYLSFTLGGTRIKNEDITKTYHKNDFGFSFGGQHDIYKNFAVSINYFIGIKNIWLADKDSFGNTFNYTNRALQFTLIYKFRKTK